MIALVTDVDGRTRRDAETVPDPFAAQAGVIERVFPFEVDNGTGEGVVIKSFIPTRRANQPDPSGGLHLKDVITSIDGHTVREMSELVRILSDYGPGAQVEVEYRRAKITGKAKQGDNRAD